jgi:hypothetical protein
MCLLQFVDHQPRLVLRLRLLSLLLRTAKQAHLLPKLPVDATIVFQGRLHRLQQGWQHLQHRQLGGLLHIYVIKCKLD